MRIICATVLALVITGLNATEYNVLPEIVQVIPLSSTDVNRVSCNSGIITDVVYSEEKGVEVKQIGKNAFIKFTIQMKGSQEKYISRNTEFHIVCDEDIYTIIGKPETGNPVIVRLGDSTKKTMEKNINKAKSITKEKQILNLTREMLSQKYDEAHRVVKENELVSLFKEVRLNKVVTVTIDGTGIVGTEYIALANKDLLNINERDFLSEKLGPNIIGITVHPKNLNKGEISRIIIVSEANR